MTTVTDGKGAAGLKGVQAVVSFVNYAPGKVRSDVLEMCKSRVSDTVRLPSGPVLPISQRSHGRWTGREVPLRAAFSGYASVVARRTLCNTKNAEAFLSAFVPGRFALLE